MNKKMFVLALLTLISLGNFCAAAVDSVVASADTNFELYNKDSMLDFKVEVGGGTVVKSDWGTTPRRLTLPTGAVGRAQIKVTDPRNFFIYVEIYNDSGTQKYVIRPGQKTTFVSYARKNSPALYPPTGQWKGLLSKTESGLSTKNNVTAADIAQGDRPVMPKTYYEIFGLPRTATADEIKKMYRKLVLERHPDKGGSAALFAELNNANEVLSDPVKRAAYDKTLPS